MEVERSCPEISVHLLLLFTTAVTTDSSPGGDGTIPAPPAPGVPRGIVKQAMRDNRSDTVNNGSRIGTVNQRQDAFRPFPNGVSASRRSANRVVQPFAGQEVEGQVGATN